MKNYKPLTKEERKQKEDEKILLMAELWEKGIENNEMPWQKPWKPGEYIADHNPITNKEEYKGYNAINLYLERKLILGTDEPRWMTFNQMLQLNAKQKDKKEEIHLEKGVKAVPIMKWSPIFINEDGKIVKENEYIKMDEEQKKQLKFLRGSMSYSAVFNYSQFYKYAYDKENNPLYDEKGNQIKIPAFEPIKRNIPKVIDFKEIEKAEEILKNSNAIIKHDQVDRNYYSPSKDEIHLTNKEQFISIEEYYSTALHELSHWTGHPTRLNRTYGQEKGDKQYAKEELIAEIGSFYLAKEANINFEPTKNNFAYVKSWIQEIKDEPSIIIESCKQATKIKDFLLGNGKKNEKLNQTISNPLEKKEEKQEIEIVNKGKRTR